jgi:hypothetical protein
MQPDLSRRRPTAAATGFPRDSDSLPGTSTWIRIALYSPGWPTACRDGIYGGTGPGLDRSSQQIYKSQRSKGWISESAKLVGSSSLLADSRDSCFGRLECPQQ